MSIYLDASLIIALLTREAHSDTARSWLSDHVEHNLHISPWTVVEVASALQLKRRLDAIDERTLFEARAAWKALANDSLSMVPVTAGHFETASALYNDSSFNLRSGDALHVAIVRYEHMRLATLDHRMEEQAQMLGVPVMKVSDR